MYKKIIFVIAFLAIFSASTTQAMTIAEMQTIVQQLQQQIAQLQQQLDQRFPLPIVQPAPPVRPVPSRRRCIVDRDCQWCGFKCIRPRPDMICPTVMPPENYRCICQNRMCRTVKTDVMPPVPPTSVPPVRPPVERPGDDRICAQVITPAINPVTGECIEFRNACAVPEGWRRVNKCPSAPAPLGR